MHRKKIYEQLLQLMPNMKNLHTLVFSFLPTAGMQIKEERALMQKISNDD